MTSTVTLKLRHFSRYSLGLVLLLFMINLSPSVSLAGDDGPEQVIQQISERLLAVLVEERDALKSDPARLYQLADEILVPHIDFAKVSSLVLGKHWSRATPNQQEAFQHAFQRLLVRTYSTAFTELQEWEIRFFFFIASIEE